MKIGDREEHKWIKYIVATNKKWELIRIEDYLNKTY